MGSKDEGGLTNKRIAKISIYNKSEYNMVPTTAEQVFVGKMSLPHVSGQISLFAPPQSFVWLKHFSAEEIAEFLTELMEALSKSQ